MFANMRWDGWELVGLFGECLFFARMIIQWFVSEKEKKPVIPMFYWHISFVGSVILVVYALHLGSFALLLSQAVGMIFYGRGICLDAASRRRDAWRHAMGLDRPDYPWPRMSVVVPVHNEEKQLDATLENLLRQEYPGDRPEIIAALNGCADASGDIARRRPVVIAEDARSGMSFGKNLGATAATGGLLVFVDADTRLPPGAFRLLAEAAAGKQRYIGTVAGKPDRGGGVVRICFRIANIATRRRRAHAPGGVMLMDRATFDAIGGFDESLPQGTSTDCIWRGIASGAEYVYVDSFRAETSIRRFEKTGIIGQMLDWRKNHRALHDGRRAEVSDKSYDDIR